MEGIPPLAAVVALLAFIVNIAVMIWVVSRTQARNESALKQEISDAARKFDLAISTERESRTAQFYEAREFARSQAADAANKADAAHSKIADVELRLLQMFTNYPTKTDMREMFGEKLEPVATQLAAVYDELMRRGIPPPSLRSGDSP